MAWLKGPKMAVIWTIVRVWLGLQWLEAGLHKVTGGFDASGFMHGAIANAAGENPAVQGWYAAFLEHFALPNVELFNYLVPTGEILIGIGLILGIATVPALIAGAFMNLNFMLAGTTSTNPIFYTLAIILLAMGTAAYCYGLDRYTIPFLKGRMIKKQTNKINKHRQIPVH